MIRYGIFRSPLRNGGDIRFNTVHPPSAFFLCLALPETLLALPVPPAAVLGMRVPAVGHAVTLATAFLAAGLRTVLMTVIAARAENDLGVTPLAVEDPTL